MHFILNPYNAKHSALMDMADIEETTMTSGVPIGCANDPLDLTLGCADVARFQSQCYSGQSVLLLGTEGGPTEQEKAKL